MSMHPRSVRGVRFSAPSVPVAADASEKSNTPDEDNIVAEEDPPSPAIEKEECVLGIPDETSDVVLEVEGRELHANRAVLAHYSPVFGKMFFSDFKEKEQSKVPLPGKSYDEMENFFNVLYPQTPTSPGLITDKNLMPVLTLADEYQADQVKARCQDYIGGQLTKHYRKHYRDYKHGVVNGQMNSGFLFGSIGSVSVAPVSPWVDRLTLYLWMCDQHQLLRYRAEVMSLLVEAIGRLDDVAKGVHYASLPLQTRVDLLEALCRKLDGSHTQHPQ